MRHDNYDAAAYNVRNTYDQEKARTIKWQPFWSERGDLNSRPPESIQNQRVGVNN